MVHIKMMATVLTLLFIGTQDADGIVFTINPPPRPPRSNKAPWGPYRYNQRPGFGPRPNVDPYQQYGPHVNPYQQYRPQWNPYQQYNMRGYADPYILRTYVPVPNHVYKS